MIRTWVDTIKEYFKDGYQNHSTVYIDGEYTTIYTNMGLPEPPTKNLLDKFDPDIHATEFTDIFNNVCKPGDMMLFVKSNTIHIGMLTSIIVREKTGADHYVVRWDDLKVPICLWNFATFYPYNLYRVTNKPARRRRIYYNNAVKLDKTLEQVLELIPTSSSSPAWDQP